MPTVLLGDDTSDVGLPLSLSAQPNWLVPTHTDTFGVVAKGNVPIVLEAQFQTGDPDAIGPSLGNAAAAVLSAPELGPGPYFGLPEPAGPFGPNGVRADAACRPGRRGEHEPVRHRRHRRPAATCGSRASTGRRRTRR